MLSGQLVDSSDWWILYLQSATEVVDSELKHHSVDNVDKVDIHIVCWSIQLELTIYVVYKLRIGIYSV